MNFPQLIIHFLILIEILIKTARFEFWADSNPPCKHPVINHPENICVAVMVFNHNTFSSMQIKWGENPITTLLPNWSLQNHSSCKRSSLTIVWTPELSTDQSLNWKIFSWWIGAMKKASVVFNFFLTNMLWAKIANLHHGAGRQSVSARPGWDCATLCSVGSYHLSPTTDHMPGHTSDNHHTHNDQWNTSDTANRIHCCAYVD